MYLSIAHKSYLLFVFIVPILVFLHFYGLKNIKGRSLKFANFEAIARVKGIDLYSKGVSSLLINITFAMLLVLALSGVTYHTEQTASEFSYVIAIDSSESMEADDFKPTRLEAAKQSAITFIEWLPPKTNVAILSFSGVTVEEQGLTDNKELMIDAINNIVVKDIGGTDVNEAVWNAKRLLKTEDSKALILMSDGQLNVGELDKTIQDAISDELIIHTLGIGTQEGGETSYGFSKLDEDSLKSLAFNTRGSYFSTQNENDLKNHFKEIMVVTRKTKSFLLTPYILMALLGLFIIKQYLLSTHRIGW